MEIAPIINSYQTYLPVPPRVKKYIHRGESEDRIEQVYKTEKEKANEQGISSVPIFAIGGLPGSGLTTYAIHFASDHGLPIWIDCEESSSKRAIVGDVANFLNHGYKRDQLDSYLRSNTEKDNPFLMEIDAENLLVEELKKDKYILCFENFYVVEYNDGINKLLERMQRFFESDPESNFESFLLISKERPVVKHTHHEEFHGFDSIEKTMQYLINHEVEISDEEIIDLHNKTDGYPGLLTLFCSLYFLESDKTEIGRKLLKNIETRDKVKDALLHHIGKRLSQDSKKAVSVLSLLRNPFNYDDGIEILNKSMEEKLNEEFADLRKKYIVSQSEGNSSYYYIHPFLRKFFINEYLGKKQIKDYNHIAGEHFENNGDYFNADYHYSLIGEFNTSARMLVNKNSLNNIIKERNIGQYQDSLNRFLKEQITDINLWREIIIRRGDISEINSEYQKASEYYLEALSLCEDLNAICKGILSRKLGWVHQRLCDWDKSIEMYHAGLQAVNEVLENDINDNKARFEQARIKAELSFVYEKILEIDLAERLGRESVEILESLVGISLEIEGRIIDINEFLAQAYYILGVTYLTKGELLFARGYIEKSERLYSLRNDILGILNAKIQLAYILYLIGDKKDEAYKMLMEVNEQSKLLNSKKHIGDSHRKMGKIDFYRGEYQNAIFHLDEALKYHSQIKDRFNEAWSHNTLAGVYEKLGDIKRAENEWFISLEILEDTNSKNDILGVYGNLTRLLMRKGDLKQAYLNWKITLNTLQPTKDLDWHFSSLINIIMMEILFSTDKKKIEDKFKICQSIVSKINNKSYTCELCNLECYYFLENNQFEKALKEANKCCTAEYEGYIDPYLKLLFTSSEISKLMKDMENAKKYYQEAKTICDKRNAAEEDMAILLRTEGLLDVGVDNNSAYQKFSQSIQKFEAIKFSLEIAETNYKIGRMLRLHDIADYSKYLKLSRGVYDSNGARARVQKIDELIGNGAN